MRSGRALRGRYWRRIQAVLTKSAIVTFPAGEIISELQLPFTRIEAATHGNYLLIRPFASYALAVMDLSTKKMFKGSKQSAMDIYDDVFVAERINGELALYDVEKNDLIAKVQLPQNRLGRLRAAAVSADNKWLAVSERARGAVWNLAKGDRAFHVRGFRGAYFSNDGALYADFPKFESAERTVARLDLATGQINAGPEIKETRAKQYGPFLLVTKPSDKTGRIDREVTTELRDSKTFDLIWSKRWPKEAPEVWIGGSNMVLSWAVTDDAAKALIKSDQQLSTRLAAMKEKEGDYLLEVLEARTGNTRGRVLIETGKGSFRIADAFAVGDWVVISDSENRVLIYSLSTGEQKGRVFGSRAAVSPAGGLLCVENETGQLAIYAMASMEKRDELTFASQIAATSFTVDGRSLIVVTADQTVYTVDVSSFHR
jgi:hypothetical protein